MFRLYRVAFRAGHETPSGIVRTPGGGGVLGISSDGDDRMEPEVKTQKNP